MRSGNPALKEDTFLDLHSGTVVGRNAQAMSLNGTVNKTGLLLLLAVLTAAFSWHASFDATGQLLPAATLYLYGGLIGGLILALITIFKQQWAPVTAPLYALVEGLFLGTVSAMYEARFDGIVLQAVILTFGTLLALLLLVFGAGGVEKIIEVSLSDEAKGNLQVSVDAVKELLVACKAIDGSLA